MCRKRISEDLRANQLRDTSAELRAWALKSQSQSRRAPLGQLVVDVDVVVAFAAAGEAAKRAAGDDLEGRHLCRSAGVARPSLARSLARPSNRPSAPLGVSVWPQHIGTRSHATIIIA